MVVIAGWRQDVLEKTAQSLCSLAENLAKITEIISVPMDINFAKQVERLFVNVKKEFGRTLEIVMANASWSSAAMILARRRPRHLVDEFCQ